MMMMINGEDDVGMCVYACVNMYFMFRSKWKSFHDSVWYVCVYMCAHVFSIQNGSLFTSQCGYANTAR